MLIPNMQSDYFYCKNSSLYLRFQILILHFNHINVEIKIPHLKGENLSNFMHNYFYNNVKFKRKNAFFSLKTTFMWINMWLIHILVFQFRILGLI